MIGEKQSVLQDAAYQLSSVFLVM